MRPGRQRLGVDGDAPQRATVGGRSDGAPARVAVPLAEVVVHAGGGGEDALQLALLEVGIGLQAVDALLSTGPGVDDMGNHRLGVKGIGIEIGASAVCTGPLMKLVV